MQIIIIILNLLTVVFSRKIYLVTEISYEFHTHFFFRVLLIPDPICIFVFVTLTVEALDK